MSSDAKPPVSPKVLIVEDEAVVALDLEMRLEHLGFQVVGTASAGDQAIEIARETAPDLILMDVSIDGPMDGIETARAILRYRDAATVFLTAYTDEATLRRAASVSPYGYLVKPFEERSLLATVTIALRCHTADARARTLSSALNASSVGVLVAAVDEGGGSRTQYANEAYLTLMGCAREDLIGRAPDFGQGRADDDGLRVVQEAYARRAQCDRVVCFERPDGSAWWASLTTTPVTSAEGVVTHMLVVCKDVTMQRVMETALADAQRIDVLGRMTAGIAHDLNNVLAAVVAFTECAINGDESERINDLREVMDAARRGGLLARKLLDFSRKRDAQPTARCDVASVLLALRSMLEYVAGAHVRIDLQVQASGLAVGLDATSVEQVVLNLVANARDASPDGGTVLIRLAESGGEGPPRLRLEVTDQGTGIDPAVQARIFEPLFTTKPRGRGTGLGLSTSRQLIEGVGGTIRVDSRLGVGSTFTVDLPILEDSPRAEPEDDERGVDAQGALCLLVEDATALRLAYTRTLTRAGFKVVSAADVDGAYQLLAAHGESLRLIVCDMVLGTGSGADVIATAQARCPQVPVLLITGYFDAMVEQVSSSHEVLWKPFSMKALRQRAIALLRGDAARAAL